MTIAAIVVAGGSGQRFGGPKQFTVVNGRTLAAWAVRACRTVADRVVLVVPADYDGDGEGADLVTVGGATRSASVRAGLAQLPPADIIVVHDAARPNASAALFQRVVDAVRAGADGAVPGVPVTDTLKRVDAGVVTETIDRETVVAVQTPQGFRDASLRAAHERGDDATDDAGLVERWGGLVVVVTGEPLNRKVTEPGDLGPLEGVL
jgi:2-C-methyl-D-erythritol 4-phosphate cytidylyltransferase